MDITFGIITSQSTMQQAAYTIKHIYDQKFSDYNASYEIIVVGGGLDGLKRWAKEEDAKYIRFIDFDETQKRKPWITRKKNIITTEAQFDTIVYMHDYMHLDKEWYNGWLDYKEDFDIAVNKILNPDGSRHSDWLVEPYLLWDTIPESKGNWNLSLPYNIRGLTKIQYISGGFWLAKKDFMLKYPLDETLLWGEAEDIYFSRRIRECTEFKINVEATTFLGKNNKWAPKTINSDWLRVMIEKYNLPLRYENV